MPQIALVTDSTADLPQKFVEEQPLEVVPLKVLFANREYIDRVDIFPQEFYERLQKTRDLPKSSQPSVEAFSNVYTRLLKEYAQVLSIHLSKKLSGVYNAARLGREELGEEKERVCIFDSQTVSLGIGVMIQEALQKIASGYEAQEVISHLERVRQKTHTFFTVDTLRYLYKGGRIGRGANFMGSLLKIKPLLEIKEGEVFPAGRARSQKQLLRLMIKKFQEASGGAKAKQLMVAHGAAKETGEKVKKVLEDTFQIKASLFGEIGPALGVHGGPGATGASLYFDHD